MAKNMRNLFWGLFFIFAGALVLLNQLGIFRRVNIFRLLITIILVFIVIKSFRYLQFGGIFVPLALLFIMYVRPYSFIRFSTFSILAAAILASIGFQMIFNPRGRIGNKKHEHDYHYKKHENFDEIVDSPDEENVNFGVSFGSSIKYVNTSNLKKADLGCNFGALKVYFDKASLNQDGTEININASFGGVELYIPSHWNVHNDIQPTLGAVNEINKCHVENGIPVVLTGYVTCGTIDIIYI